VKDPKRLGEIVEQTFARIHRENMQGIPILNSKIRVQTLGFQHYQERVVGVVITPWLMNMVLLPGEGEDWSELVLGHKRFHNFPAKKYKFMVNEIDGIGFCQTHSLHSPMNEFSSHEHAVSVAQDFLDKLMVDSSPAREDLVDEDLLGRIMRGEETPEVNLDDFATIQPHESCIPIKIVSGTKVPARKKFDRRALLRGRFLEGS